MNAAWKAGSVVRSVAGHDKGGLFVVLEPVDRDFVLIADGKTRTVEKPKKKKRKHLRAVSAEPMPITVEAKPINAELRKYLKTCEQKIQEEHRCPSRMS